MYAGTRHISRAGLRQPGVLDNAQEIFDDFVETLQILAIELDGTIRDHKKHILKDATIQAIRLSL